MENGPFRMNNAVPTRRGAAERSVSADRAVDDDKAVEQVVAEQAEPERRPTESRSEKSRSTSRGGKFKRNKFKWLGGLVITVVVLVGLFLAGSWYMNRGNSAVDIDSGKFQAVFFTNGQVYFGKLQPLNASYMKLTNIFYLQSTATDSKNPQQTNTDQSANVQLIKLGNEIHGPVDEMVISKDQILFFENLKKDGKVSDTISKYQNPS